MDEAGGRRSSLVGQALVPSPGNAVSELHKERSFCNPEDTEEAAAIGRQVSSCLTLKFKCVFLKQRRLILSMPSHFRVEMSFSP